MKLAALAAALGLATASFAQAPADAPAGTNGLCNDGTYSQAAQKKGACSRHQGVKEWYGAASSSSSGASASSGSASAPPPAAASPPAATSPTAAAPAAPAAPAMSAKAPAPSTPPANPAPGGGPGMVWVNSASNVYHCPGDRWYGKTKQGEYMSEADAKAKGARPDHGKACQS